MAAYELRYQIETNNVISTVHDFHNSSHNPADNRGQFVIPGPLQNPGRSRLVSNVLYAVGGEELNGARLRSVSSSQKTLFSFKPFRALLY